LAFVYILNIFSFSSYKNDLNLRYKNFRKKNTSTIEYTNTVNQVLNCFTKYFICIFIFSFVKIIFIIVFLFQIRINIVKQFKHEINEKKIETAFNDEVEIFPLQNLLNETPCKIFTVIFFLKLTDKV